MATSSLNTTSLLNLSYLTENCGTKLCRKLFLKRVFDLKPIGQDDESWTVDKFLKLKKQDITESKKLRKCALEKVFPVKRDCTHLDEWDLSLFCCILGVTGELDSEFKLYLNALKRLRNKLAHMGDADIDDKKCEHSKEKLKFIFKKILDHLNDKELEMTIQEMFTKADAGHVSDNEIAQALRVMRASYEEMKEDIVSCKEETVNCVQSEHKETREKLEKGQSKLEKLLIDIHQHVVRSESDINMTDVPVVGLEIGTTNGSTDTDENFSEMMVELFNAEITNDPNLSSLSNSNHHQIREAIHRVCESFKANGYVIIKAERRCILLHIKCSSISALLSLYIDYMQGHLDVSFSEIRTAAQRIDKFKGIRIEAILYENDVYQTLTFLDLTQTHSKGIDVAKNELVNEKDNTNQYSEVFTVGKNNSFLLHVKLPSHLHQSNFETFVSSETARLAEELNLGVQSKLVVLDDSENKVEEFPSIEHTEADDSGENLEESSKSISVKLDTEVTLNFAREKNELKHKVERNLHNDNTNYSTDRGDEITVKSGQISRSSSEGTKLLAPEVRATYGLHSNTTEPESPLGFKGVVTKWLLRLRSDDGSRRKVVKCTKVRVESVRCFRRGQHVAIPGRVGKIYISLTRKQKFLYMKHCILSNVIQSSGTRVKMNLIYFNKECLIKQATESFDLRFDEIYIVEYTDDIYLPDEIVNNAESFLSNPRGENASKLKSFTDSESFATWCSVGDGETMQRSVGGKIRNILSSAADDKEKIHSLSLLMKGDVISFPKYGFEHELIVSENVTKSDNSVSGKIRCIHYKPANKLNIFGRREIVEENIFINLETTTVKVHRFPSEKSYRPDVVVERARKRIGETKWAVNSNRSCHFCFWAKMKHRPREEFEEQDNSAEFYVPSTSDVLSSLVVEKIETHLMNDILVGDVVTLDNMCIVEDLRSLDSDLGREFEMHVLVYDSSWIVRRKAINVNLNKDTVIITKYHPVHCHPMATRVNRAKFWLNKKCRWWTTAGFINDCILLHP